MFIKDNGKRNKTCKVQDKFRNVKLNDFVYEVESEDKFIEGSCK